MFYIVSSLYPSFLQSRLHILSRVFRSTAKEPILEWDESDEDPQEWKGVIRISWVSKFQPYNKHKIFRFLTLYTTIPHDKLKSRLASIIQKSFIFKNGNRRFKYLILGHEEAYFVKVHSDSKSKYTEDLLVDNIFVFFVVKVFT